MFMGVLSACMCVCHGYAWCSGGSEEGVRSSGTVVTNGCEPLGGCWELSLDLCRSSKCSYLLSPVSSPWPCTFNPSLDPVARISSMHHAQLESSSFFFFPHGARISRPFTGVISVVSESGVHLCFEEFWDLKWNFIGNNNKDEPILDEDGEEKSQ